MRKVGDAANVGERFRRATRHARRRWSEEYRRWANETLEGLSTRTRSRSRAARGRPPRRDCWRRYS